MFQRPFGLWLNTFLKAHKDYKGRYNREVSVSCSLNDNTNLSAANVYNTMCKLDRPEYLREKGSLEKLAQHKLVDSCRLNDNAEKMFSLVSILTLISIKIFC